MARISPYRCFIREPWLIKRRKARISVFSIHLAYFAVFASVCGFFWLALETKIHYDLVRYRERVNLLLTSDKRTLECDSLGK